ncbi:hypothetical protein [Salinisphaera sp.]|uniref:hypothetical protein n=1 Tax=Salinisphaera sp. TaxID=1914330 RepID=UPI002D793EF9|nr:hypothetical protein [Salinisphaera sp.]HET7312879.1 hypothetical protein [Salinisphaera sp.]
MHKSDRRARAGLAIALAIAAALAVGIAGCAHEKTAPPTPPMPAELSAPALTLLGYARRLARTTPEGREAAVRAARKQVRKTPGAISYAYLALALGSPHQRLYTPDGAARYAKLALETEPAPWDPDARQYLGDYARLYGELTQTREAAENEDSHTERHIAELKKRLSSEDSYTERRIAELEKRLFMARKKLNALSNIEDRLDNVEDHP